MKNSKDLGLAVLRIGFSLLILSHGIPKIEMLFADPVQFADPIGFGPVVSLILAIIGEVIAPIFVIIGFKTRLAAIPPMATMLVAFFLHHSEDPFNTKEKALMYFTAFLVIFIAGAGRYGLDKN